MSKKLVEFVWCICYINKDFIENLEKDLGKNPKYKDIETYVPAVKVLKKKFKGKDHFEDVPLLFNYGFVKMPRIQAISDEFLIRLKKDVKAIYSWVRDPSAVMSEEPILSLDNKETRNKRHEYSVATATEKEISKIIASASNLSIYSKEDIERLKPGMSITLHGYPFDNVPAVVVKIDKKKRKVKVKLELFRMMKEASVDFDNVFYTVYKSKFNEEPTREVSLDELKSNAGNGSLDNIFAKAKFYQDPDEEWN